VLPTYNERENIQSIVVAIVTNAEIDVLVVDDGSPDGTGTIAESLAARYPARVHVLHRPKKLGLGSACVAGFRFALEHGYASVCTMDADFSHDPASLPDVVAGTSCADVAVGSRYTAGGSTPGWPLSRRLLSRLGNLYARAVLGVPVSDLTSGFKCYRRQVLERLALDRLTASGYAVQIELTHRVHRLGFQLREIPIAFRDRRAGQSKMSWAIAREAFLIVLQLRLEADRGRRRRPVPT
jgi:dolichol-phosphate mannosyltransferase